MDDAHFSSMQGEYFDSTGAQITPNADGSITVKSDQSDINGDYHYYNLYPSEGGGFSNNSGAQAVSNGSEYTATQGPGGGDHIYPSDTEVSRTATQSRQAYATTKTYSSKSSKKQNHSLTFIILGSIVAISIVCLIIVAIALY